MSVNNKISSDGSDAVENLLRLESECAAVYRGTQELKKRLEALEENGIRVESVLLLLDKALDLRSASIAKSIGSLEERLKKVELQL